VAGRKTDNLKGMVIPFAETTGKEQDMGRKVEFSLAHIKYELLATLVQMTNDSWRSKSGVLGEVLACRFTFVSHLRVDDITVTRLGGDLPGRTCN
jgi:hypothetical protein